MFFRIFHTLTIFALIILTGCSEQKTDIASSTPSKVPTKKSFCRELAFYSKVSPAERHYKALKEIKKAVDDGRDYRDKDDPTYLCIKALRKPDVDYYLGLSDERLQETKSGYKKLLKEHGSLKNIYLALEAGQVSNNDVMKVMLQHGVNAIGYGGNNPLMAFAKSPYNSMGFADLFNYAYVHGLNINQTNDSGRTLLDNYRNASNTKYESDEEVKRHILNFFGKFEFNNSTYQKKMTTGTTKNVTLTRQTWADEKRSNNEFTYGFSCNGKTFTVSKSSNSITTWGLPSCLLSSTSTNHTIESAARESCECYAAK